MTPSAASPKAATVAAAFGLLIVLSSSAVPAAAKMFCSNCDDICNTSCVNSDTITKLCAPQCDGCSPEACQSCLQALKQECLAGCSDYCHKNCT
uniref:Bowman-Birk serine protease inhibitors family domain-containing protein n=1 Tax=Oryza punctata TaxID=4537 RepID=A0A0E0MM47_ORYPU